MTSQSHILPVSNKAHGIW